MDVKQLFQDILRFNTASMRVRRHKMMAIVKRKLFLPFYKTIGKGKDLKQVPILINNRNRLTFLKQQIDWLEQHGYSNIYIIDNQSTYPPLLAFYENTKYTVFRLEDNVGHLALWKTQIHKKFNRDYYVYTDPDVVPVENCPGDVIAHFMDKLHKYPQIEKIGFGLKIDDLPDHYAEKQKVVEWESKFWEKEVEPGLFDAALDTTFALYRPYTNGLIWVQKAYRTGGKYVARHLPWYENTEHPTEEDQYYKNQVRNGVSHWITNETEKN